jgi:uncharacterized protein (TIGR02444 family)
VNETAAGLGAFWAFSLRLYGAAGVQQTLLRMQDEDAPHMAIAWTRRRCGAEQGVAPWRDHVLRPLRAVRRGMKGMTEGNPAAEALRARVKEDELEAERLLHDTMEIRAAADAASPDSSASGAVRRGLSANAVIGGFALPDAERDVLVAALVTILVTGTPGSSA